MDVAEGAVVSGSDTAALGRPTPPSFKAKVPGYRAVEHRTVGDFRHLDCVHGPTLMVQRLRYVYRGVSERRLSTHGTA